MRCSPTTSFLAVLLCMVAVSTSSCSKEELVAPAGSPEFMMKTTGQPAVTDGGGCIVKPGGVVTGGAGDGSGISDDGDDISGSERRKRPS